MANTFLNKLKEDPISATFQVGGVLVVIANLYLLNQLQPISSSLALANQKLESHTEESDKLYDLMQTRLDRLETKMDKLLEK